MSLTSFSPATFALGLAALAGLLFVLQRLRVRHRPLTVVTTLFWREALEETRARVFTRRFRHPWAYLLLLLLAGLIWLAAAEPRAGASSGSAHVILIDGSARMGRAGAFAEALRLARERVRELPRERTRVVLAGAFARTLLAPGEELPLFDQRVRELAPEACPSSIERTLSQLAAIDAGAATLEVEIVSTTAPASALATQLSGVNLRWARVALDAKPNEGLLAVGLSPARSGAWDRVDVLVTSASAEPPVLTLDGRALAPEDVGGADGRIRVIARDVPAQAGRLEARLAGSDALALDDAAAQSLPLRPLVRVALSPSVPASVRAALAADPGLVLVEGPADVVLRAAGEDFGAGTSALELTPDAQQDAAFVARAPATGDAGAELELRRAYRELGLDEIDGLSLAEQAARPIELRFEAAPARSLSIWASLCGPEFDFTRTQAFPLFLARAVRWLARAELLDARLAAGELRLDHDETWTESGGCTLDPAGGEARLPRAGEYQDARGRVHAAALFDAAQTVGPAAPIEAPRARVASAFEPLPWIIALVLVLLFLEWWLVRSERIP